MAINPTLKLASIAIGTGGVITGGAVGIYKHINKSTEEVKKNADSSPKPPIVPTTTKKAVSEFLKGTNLALLQDGDDREKEWKPKWEAFKSEHTEDPTGDWKIEDWTANKVGDKGLDEFKKVCLRNGTKEIERTDPILEKIKKYCTKSTSTEKQ